MKQVGSYLVPNVLATGMAVDGNYAYVGFLDPQLGLKILDISNPANPRLVGSYISPGEYPDEIFLLGDLAYVSYFERGWKILNIADRTHPVLVSEMRDIQVRDIYVVPPYAYVAARWSGMYIYNVANPAAPVRLSHVGSYQYSGKVFVTNNLAYLCDGNAGMQVLDVSDPRAPLMLSLLPAHYEFLTMAIKGSTAYIVDRQGLVIADYANPAAPREIGFYPVPDTMAGLDVDNDYAYTVRWGGRVQALDVKNPQAPFEVAWASFPLSTARELAVHEGCIYIIGIGGLLTYSLGDMNPPTIHCPDVLAGCSPNLLETVEFTVTATDDVDGPVSVTCSPPSGSTFPVGITVVTCQATDASGNTTIRQFSVNRPPLGFTGFFPPLAGADASGGSYAAPLREFKLGSTIPVSFALNCGGAPVAEGIHRLEVIQYFSPDHPGQRLDAIPNDHVGISKEGKVLRRLPTAPEFSTGKSSGHLYFPSVRPQGAYGLRRLDPTLGNEFRQTGGQWHFNLDTLATGMSKGLWQLRATFSDGSTHQAWILLK